MKKYNFKTTTIFLLFIRFIVTSFVTLIPFTIIALNNYIKLNNKFLFISSFLIVFFVVYFLTKKKSIIEVWISFTDKIEIELKYPFLKKRKYVFFISDIKSYLYEYGNGYKVFYLNKRKGINFKFLIFTETENLKSFDNFYDDLKIQIQKHNMANSNLIHEKPTIYKTKIGMMYGIIISICLIIIPICYIILKTKVNYGILLILYPAGIIFLYRLYMAKKK